MDLFEHNAQELTERNAPLAARMRPRTLDEFVGQEHILAPGRLLRRAIEVDRLTSLIFYGPPGTGKTTLAAVIAQRTRAHFTAINAVLAGVKDLREAVADAQRRLGERGQPTVLFVDEVHRFNKAQQDALLPWVERGTVILIGATTENPYFEVNKALVSRSRIFGLRPLEERHLRAVLRRALTDRERGYGGRTVEVTAEAEDHLVDRAAGDARSLLGALELAVETTEPGDGGVVRVDLAVAEESIQQRAVLYDKEGDAHYDTVSAFIKSLRGSDPDASLYWMARMVYAGEDPHFIFRRMVIFASEDVGLAAPQVIAQVMALAQAFDRVGMPEGRFHLSQAALLLATSPKSNSTMGFFDALAAVGAEAAGDVPAHLKDASRDRQGFGHGEGYLYPHAYRDHWVAQQYLPDALQGRLFYDPSRQGYEAALYDEVMRRREAQLEAMIAGRGALGQAPGEVLTAGPQDARLEAWLQRTLGNVGDRLAEQRDLLMERAALRRHHVVLDLHAGSGLLVWEAMRRCPEGGVWARAATEQDAQAIDQRARSLDLLLRPHAFAAPLDGLDEALGVPELRFDRVLGRNALVGAPLPARTAALQAVARRLRPGTGRLVLLEGLPRATQRLYELVLPDALDAALLERWRHAEEALYQEQEPVLLWDEDTLREALEAAALRVQSLEVLPWTARRRIPAAEIDRWFAPGDGRPSYRDRLATTLSDEEVAQIEALLRARLTDGVVDWGGAMAVAVSAAGG